MKKLGIFFSIMIMILISHYVKAQDGSTSTDWSDPIPWKADPNNTIPGNDTVTIQSGTGINAQVRISVDHNSTGAVLSNCGSTTRLSPGSTAICSTGNPNKPVTITSDTLNQVSVGTYQIKTP